MNKKVLKITGGIVVLGGIFAAGTFTGATTDLFTNAENQAYSQMLGTANSVNTQIENKATSDIENTVNTAVTNTVESNQDELKRLLEEYYQLKLSGVTDTEQFRHLEEQIQKTMEGLSSTYKEKIDQVFVENGINN